MRGRPLPLEALISIPRVADDKERKAHWRQAFTFIGQQPRIDGPPPLDGVDVSAVIQSCRVALDAGWVDDLDWISSEQALVALYELTTALPPGHERREMGRRVFSRVYGGPAPSFVAVAQRMAWSGVRQLETPPMRARLSLCLSLPIGCEVNADPLALALISGEERLTTWVVGPSRGPLPARRLAGCILEKAAREAVRRAQQGDAHPLDWMLSERVRPVYERLLADREPLVWRHAAVARGILSAHVPELREEIELQLDPGLSPTEWRRAIVSLVACLAHDTDTAVKQCHSLLGGHLMRQHPGLLSAALWGLPPVVEAEPELAEELLERVAEHPRYDVAEELVLLRQEVQDVGFAATAATKMARGLVGAGVADDAAHAALVSQTRARLLGGTGPLGEKLRRALIEFETTGALPAYAMASDALHEAHRLLRIVESSRLDPEGMVEAYEELSDLGFSVLERRRLHDMMLLGKRPGENDTHVPQFDKLVDRLGSWLLRCEQRDELEPEQWTPTEVLLRRRRLVMLLHLLDSESSDSRSEKGAEVLRQRLRTSLLSLLEQLSDGPDATVHRVLCAALARSFDAAVREGMVEPSDLLLLVVARIDELQSLRAIAEGSTDEDMRRCLSAYERFLSALRDEDDHDQMQPRSRGQVVAEAFRALSRAVGVRGSYRGEALRQCLQRLGRCLELVSMCRSLSELVADDNGTGAWADDLERAADALEALIFGAKARVHGARSRTRRSSLAPANHEGLSRLVERQLSQRQPIDRAELESTLAALVRALPQAIGAVIVELVGRLHRLPVSASTQRAVIPLKKRRIALPDWLLPRRTIGGFYVVRALGSGGVSTVFVAKRIEERKNATAETYALKIPHYDPTTARSLSEQEFLDMFREEAGALLSLPVHPNLSAFVTFDMAAKPKPILVMELIAGQALEKLILQRKLSAPEVFTYLEGILAGMAAMHTVGVAHLDIKPSNVILRDETTPALVDFGLSGRQLRPGCGTLEYCAPEVLGVIPEGYVPDATRADVYSFGCLAFELFTGELLFDAENETALMGKHVAHDGWPPPLAELAEKAEYRQLAAVIGACLRRDPRNRPSAHELRSALQKLQRRVDVGKWPWPLSAEPSAPGLSA